MLNTNLKIAEFDQMSAEQAWRDHCWGIELEPKSTVYYHEHDNFIIAVGKGYDGIWDCDIIDIQWGGAVSDGQGETPQEALDEALSIFAGVTWV